MRSAEGPAPGADHGAGGVQVERQRRRVAEVVFTQAGSSEETEHDVAVTIGAVVTGADQCQLLVVDGEPGGEHRRRLQGLQRRAGVHVDRRVAGGEDDVTTGVEGDHRAVVHRLVETVAIGDGNRHVAAAAVELIHDWIRPSCW